MNELRALDLIGQLDEKIIDEATKPFKKRRVHIFYLASAAIAVIVAILLCVIIGGTILKIKRSNHEERIGESSGTIPGADEIYPTILIDGNYYEWKRGRAILMDYAGRPLPLSGETEYYGEIIHTDNDYPTMDKELVCTFNVTGSVYINPKEKSSIYLVISTDWMTDTVVVFDLIE